MQVEYVGGDAFNMPRTVREVTARAGARFIVYGACNPPDRSNLETVRWCHRSFIVGGDGALPWQCLDATGEAFTTSDTNGLIVARYLPVDLPPGPGRPDAASIRFDRLSIDGLIALKAGVLAALDEGR